MNKELISKAEVFMASGTVIVPYIDNCYSLMTCVALFSAISGAETLLPTKY
jgi:hypothetical protein